MRRVYSSWHDETEGRGIWMISVITPTYNRAYILFQAYDSLCAQTSKAFEWIVVDDGSTDQTEQMVKAWEKEQKEFSVHYYKKPNGGKHRAVNFGVQQAKYGYILILDSDDYLTNDAIECIHQWTLQIQGKEDFAGVAGLRGWKNSDAAIGGDLGDKEYIDAANHERAKYGLSGDKAEVYRTELLRKYPFPEFEGEGFISEASVWNKISLDGYRIRWFNKVVYKCEYLEDGLTNMVHTGEKLMMNNFQGYTYYIQLLMQSCSFPVKHFKIGQYADIARRKGKSLADVMETLQIARWELWLGQLIFQANKVKRMLRNGRKKLG